MVQYEDISEYITSQRLLDENQICPGPIQCFEPTSGSSGAKKLIPYNTAILKSFAHLFKVWCADLFIHGPSLQRGKIWYSVSPQFAVGDSPSDGFEDDSEYLSGTSRKILKRFLPVDPRLKKVQDSDDYFLILSCYLLSCEDLEAISIWNPSFLIRILEFIDDNKSLIVSTLEQSHYHSQGIDSYLSALENLDRSVGELSGRFAKAEGWRLHLHAGFAKEEDNFLQEALYSEFVFYED